MLNIALTAAPELIAVITNMTNALKYQNIKVLEYADSDSTTSKIYAGHNFQQVTNVQNAPRQNFQTGTASVASQASRTEQYVQTVLPKEVPVSAKDNSQMMLNALGVYMCNSFLYPIDTVKMTIVQPRIDSISEDNLSIEELLKWGESIKPIAKLAIDGEEEYVPGEHCRFCRARADHYLSLEEFHKMKPPLIFKEEVGEILRRAQELSLWVKSLEEFALSE